MNKQLKKLIKPYIPHFIITAYRFFSSQAYIIRLYAFLVYPVNKVKYLYVGKKFLSKPRNSYRVFKYNHSFLPNKYVADLELESVDIETALQKTGASIGYPAWNLLYFSLICSLPGKDEQKAVIVETGTNMGFSTIIMAQALKDSGAQGCVYTVDIDEKIVALARQNIEKAGLTEYVKFHVQDSLVFLKKLVQDIEYVNFAFLDGCHKYPHVKKEFSIIYPKIVACRGKVYFDNTTMGGVAKGLYFIKHAYSGNMLEFRNCSWRPPGNVIWQPSW